MDVGDPRSDETTVWEELPTRVGAARLRAAQPFDDFYAREFVSLVALARALTGSTTAEDIAQEAMIAAYRRWPQVEQLDSPAAWVRRVCANISTSFVRRRAAEARAVLRISSMRDEPTELSPRDEDFWACVRRLPRRQAQVISLHYVYDLGVSDIAHTLGCSESSVKAHLVRGRASLSGALRPHEEERS
jgi:RNA polymerase sigma-70 factor (ECF subfamily)